MRKDAKITVIRVAFVEGRIDVISRLSAKSGRSNRHEVRQCFGGSGHSMAYFGGTQLLRDHWSDVMRYVHPHMSTKTETRVNNAL